MTFLGLGLLLCGFFSNGFASDLACKDEKGNTVDWWYAYKLPKNSSQTDEDIALGDAYLYLLSTQTSSKDWSHSTSNSQSSTSLMGRTLAPIYTSSASDMAYVLYNDEKPDGTTSSSRGHTKGVLALDQSNGFWLVHSVPKYPPMAADGYSYPDSGLTYGQSYLCVSLKTADADVIGLQFQYNIPNYYEINMPSWSEAALPQLWDATINGVHVASEPYSNVATFPSAAGVTFTSFAKHTKYAKDLYGDLVAPNIKSDIDVETWNHGSDELPSVCGTYTIKNVNQINVNVLGYSFSNYNDHSKFAVAPTTAPDPWVCVGDINRMESQENRAGGTVCQKNTPAWNVYSKSVATVDSCPTKSG